MRMLAGYRKSAPPSLVLVSLYARSNKPTPGDYRPRMHHVQMVVPVHRRIGKFHKIAPGHVVLD